MNSTVGGLSERHILHGILAALGSRRDLVVWRQSVGVAKDTRSGAVVRFGTPGMADVMGVLEGGRLLSLEVKSGTGRLRPEQAAWLERMRQLGAVAAVVRSVEEAVEVVETALGERR